MSAAGKLPLNKSNNIRQRNCHVQLKTAAAHKHLLQLKHFGHQ
jgi:hypothetical protein